MKNKFRIKKPFYKQAFPMTIFILLIVYAVSFLTPFIWAIFTSLTTGELFDMYQRVLEGVDTPWDIFCKAFSVPVAEYQVKYIHKPTGEIRVLTTLEGFTFSNYEWALLNIQVDMPLTGGVAKIDTLFFNSFIYTIVATAITTTTHSVTAYIAARYSHHKIASILYPIVIVTMLLPIVGALPSELKMMQDLHMYDRVWGIWLMKGGFLGTNFLIFYASFKSISWEYAEAAFVDGASHFRVLVQIMMPLAAGTLGALALMTFITFWNDWKVNVQYVPNTWPMISYALFRFNGDGSIKGLTVPNQMAGCIMIATPLILLFIAFRKKLMGSITIGGIKG